MSVEQRGTETLRERGLRHRVRRAAVAASMATVAENALVTLIMHRRHGREPVFLPRAMVRRMAGELGYVVDDRAARLIGNVMRAGYGPAWGIGWALLRGRRAPRPVHDACLLAAVMWMFELVMLPAVRATPPVRLWPRGDVAWDLANCAIFAATDMCVTALMDSSPQVPRAEG
jgi:hypothetical protein